MDAADSSPVLVFGRFTVDRHRREFVADGQPIELGGRALDTLLALIDARGSVLSKDELIRRVWPDRIVEENNLERHISALRKALGLSRSLIRTVPRRGYQFTGDVRPATTAGGAPRMVDLPVPVSELIGRASEISDVMALATAHRLVTLTGVGGIGKTRLALEAARRLGRAFPDGVFLADLAPLSHAAVVPVTAAVSMNLSLVADAVTPERIGASIGAQRILLVLDNCEHLIEAAALLAQGLLRSAPGIALLCTSREPLRVDGEHVYRVVPLAVPPDDVSAENVLTSEAVKLFVSRARAAEPTFLVDDNVAAMLGAICRRVDGLPLAIELAAARIPSFGAAGVASYLHDRFTLLTGGSRTALPRQQTLRATLDWSHDLLSPRERLVLRRLSVFAGAFTLDAATEVVSGTGVSIPEVEDDVANLVGKSLLSAEARGAMQYRLLETMREYALGKLRESGEYDRFAQRHAEYHARVCERTDIAGGTDPPPEWRTIYGRLIENVRLALDWAFSSTGDPGVGVVLTVAAVPLWMHLSLMTECRARVEQALGSLRPDGPPNPRRDMQLLVALGTALFHTGGIGSPDMETASTKALELADSLDDPEYRLRATYGLCLHRFVNGDYRGALALADELRAVAARTADPADLLIIERFVAAVLHGMGDQAAALRHVEPLVRADFTTNRRSHIIRYHFDQRTVTHCYYARILWVQGFPDRALAVAADVVDFARASDHVISLLYALFEAACPLAVYAGDLGVAERYVALVRELSMKHAMRNWGVWGQCYEGMILIQQGQSAGGVQCLQVGLDALPAAAFHLHRNMLRAELAEGLGTVGQIEDGVRVIDEALDRAERLDERWCFAELLRKKGELLLRRKAPTDRAEAQDCFVKALESARRQDARMWELRAATSLARLLREEGRAAQARRILAPVHHRFTEGFETADLVAAKKVLAGLRLSETRRAPTASQG
jgi:predicted ATPase/DNA-binding winged helix-turn-helix (wHTH) protein